MGQAKNRGNFEQRIGQAKQKLASLRPQKITCNKCQADITELSDMDTKGIKGLTAVFAGRCTCGHDTFALLGEPEVVEEYSKFLAENM